MVVQPTDTAAVSAQSALTLNREENIQCILIVIIVQSNSSKALFNTQSALSMVLYKFINFNHLR
ncbi:hypothetical protein J538_0346 [Acinetobacter sp. 272263]|nr:hypothetical protein J538_0346 [Acinetobacter sp. 272263]